MAVTPPRGLLVRFAHSLRLVAATEESAAARHFLASAMRPSAPPTSRKVNVEEGEGGGQSALALHAFGLRSALASLRSPRCRSCGAACGNPPKLEELREGSHLRCDRLMEVRNLRGGSLPARFSRPPLRFSPYELVYFHDHDADGAVLLRRCSPGSCPWPVHASRRRCVPPPSRTPGESGPTYNGATAVAGHRY